MRCGVRGDVLGRAGRDDRAAAVAASRAPGSTSAAAIAAASSIGYSGMLIGPPLIGAIAHVTSLATALWVVVGALGLLAIGAGGVRSTR